MILSTFFKIMQLFLMFLMFLVFLLISSAILIFGKIILLFSSNDDHQCLCHGDHRRQRIKSSGDVHQRLRMCVQQPTTLSAEGKGRMREELEVPTSNNARLSLCRKTFALLPLKEIVQGQAHTLSERLAHRLAKPGWASSPLSATGKFSATETLLAEGKGRITKDFRRSTSGRTRPLATFCLQVVPLFPVDVVGRKAFKEQRNPQSLNSNGINRPNRFIKHNSWKRISTCKRRIKRK